MLKIIILAVLAVLVGLGGGSAFSVMKAKKAFASQDAIHAKVVSDSLAKMALEGSQHPAPSVPADSSGTGVDSSRAGTVAATSAGDVPVTHVETGAAPATPKGTKTPAKGAAPTTIPPAPAWSRAVATVEAGVIVPPTAPPSVTHGPSQPYKVPAKVPDKSAAPSIAPERIGKIFTAMPAKDAAKILVQLDDTEVQLILAAVNAKQAAAILQNFPPVRAAAISKAALRGGATTP